MKIKKRDDISITKFIVGPMEANCYVLADPATKDACLIDPGGDPGTIKNFLKKNEYRLRFIINTHGHGDHIAANRFFNCPVYIHRLDQDFLTDPDKNLSSSFLLSIQSPEASKTLEDGDRIKLGGVELEIIHTPGHTRGSVSVKCGAAVFTGDTLFHSGIGRTDLYGGDSSLIMESIRSRLFTLDDDTVVYPGHGEDSTIGEEKVSNPFFAQDMQ